MKNKTKNCFHNCEPIQPRKMVVAVAIDASRCVRDRERSLFGFNSKHLARSYDKSKHSRYRQLRRVIYIATLWRDENLELLFPTERFSNRSVSRFKQPSSLEVTRMRNIEKRKKSIVHAIRTAMPLVSIMRPAALPGRKERNSILPGPIVFSFPFDINISHCPPPLPPPEHRGVSSSSFRLIRNLSISFRRSAM